MQIKKILFQIFSFLKKILNELELQISKIKKERNSAEALKEMFEESFT